MRDLFAEPFGHGSNSSPMRCSKYRHLGLVSGGCSNWSITVRKRRKYISRVIGSLKDGAVQPVSPVTQKWMGHERLMRQWHFRNAKVNDLYPTERSTTARCRACHDTDRSSWPCHPLRRLPREPPGS